MATAGGKVMALTDANFDAVMNQYDIVLVNFYANWCRFSQVRRALACPFACPLFS